MRRGTVYQRHLISCPRAPDGAYAPHKCRGLWSYVVDLGRNESGRRIQRTQGGFPTKRDAHAALAAVLQETRAGVDVASTITVRQYLPQWLDGKRSLRPSTQKAYREHLHLYLIPMLGDHKLRDLRAEHIDLFISHLAVLKRSRPLTNATIRRIYATLRNALNDAVGRRLIAFNPAVHVELPVERRTAVIVWTPPQVARFLQASKNHRLYALFHLAVMTGMRRGEIAGLRWEDLDLDARYLQVNQQRVRIGNRTVIGPPKTKTGTRTVALDAVTVAVMQRHRDAQHEESYVWSDRWVSTGYVFTKRDGRPLYPEEINVAFNRLIGLAGLPRIRFHDLRHTSASLALAAGVQMKVVSERLGHSTTGITADLYTHVSPAVAHAAADAIAAIVPLDTEC